MLICEASKPARDRSLIASLAFFKSVNNATTTSETLGIILVEFIPIAIHLSILRCIATRLGNRRLPHERSRRERHYLRLAFPCPSRDTPIYAHLRVPQRTNVSAGRFFRRP